MVRSELHERLVVEIGKVITVDPVKAAEQVDTRRASRRSNRWRHCPLADKSALI
jgi:hypothetical protein